MGEQGRSAQEAARQLRGLAMAERIREALEDRFEVEVREAVIAGLEHPVEQLHDYLTGVADAHEPRVRLLFELVEAGAFEPTGPLADVPATCFFLGDRARYERSLSDWLALFGPPRAHGSDGEDLALPQAGAAGVDPDDDVVDLWSAGDLVWGRSRERAQASADYLGLLLDRPVGLWHARVRPADLRIVASDVWSGRDEGRVVVPPGTLAARQVTPGGPVPIDRPLAPRPRIVDSL